MMNIVDDFNSFVLICFFFKLFFFPYLSPGTESLYLFFTQALGIQLWGEVLLSK